MVPQFRFTLTWTPLDGSTAEYYELPTTEEPRGWKDIELKLERDNNLSSVVEYFSAPLDFFGPAWGAIKGWEAIDGVRTRIQILIEILEDDQIGYEFVFHGLIAVKELEDRKKADKDYIGKIPTSRNDTWSRLLARFESEVNLKSATDLYGNAVDVSTEKTLRLTSQKIAQTYEGHQTNDTERQLIIPDGQYASIDFTDERRDEIKDKYTLLIETVPNRPSWKFAPAYGGELTFFSTLYFYQGSFIGSSIVDPGIKIRIQINDDAPVTFTKTNVTVGIDSWSQYDLSTTITVQPKDKIRLYIKNESGSSQTINWYAGVIQDSKFIIGAHTIFPDSSTPGFLVHDIGYSILDRIIGQQDGHKFYSEFFGHTSYTEVVYDAIGCGFPYIVFLGLHARGFTLSEKLMAMSMAKWYGSLDAIFNLGMGYENIAYIFEFDEEHLALTSDANFALSLENNFQQPGDYTITGSIVGTRSTTAGTFEISLIAMKGNQIVTVIAINTITAGVGTVNTITLSGTYTITGAFDRLLVDVRFRGGASYGLDIDFDFEGLKEVIAVEEKEHFFDSSDTSVILLNVPDLIRVYDENSNIKDIEIGYSKWEAEDFGVLDDPQAKSNYATIFETVGIPKSIISDFIAAGLVIEATRRKSVEKSKDWRFDNDPFIVAIDPILDSGAFNPELDENFTDLDPLKLIDPDFRYNLRLWPVWNLLRWSNYLNCGLTKYPTSVFKFISGQGNYNAEGTMDPDSDCILNDDTLISCMADIPVNIGIKRTTPLHSNELYSAKVPMSWAYYKAIRDNKNLAIGIGLSDSFSTFDDTFDFTFQQDGAFDQYFNKVITWKICHAEGSFTFWKK